MLQAKRRRARERGAGFPGAVKVRDEFLQTHAGEGDEAGEGAGFDGAVHWHGDRPLRFAQDDVRAGLATFDETGPPGRARTASAPLTSRGNFI